MNLHWQGYWEAVGGRYNSTLRAAVLALASTSNVSGKGASKNPTKAVMSIQLRGNDRNRERTCFFFPLPWSSLRILYKFTWSVPLVTSVWGYTWDERRGKLSLVKPGEPDWATLWERTNDGEDYFSWQNINVVAYESFEQVLNKDELDFAEELLWEQSREIEQDNIQTPMTLSHTSTRTWMLLELHIAEHEDKARY